jgi:hypothetical protein
LPGTPFKSTAEDAKVRISLVQLIHFFRKPRAWSMDRIVVCSIVSNAFSKSNLRTTNSLLD